MIRSLLSFELNKKQTPFQITKRLVEFIEKYSSNNPLINSLLLDINKNTKIPIKTLQQKLNQILFRSFDFKFNEFKNYDLFYIFIDFSKFFTITLINIVGHILLNFTEIKKKNFELLCDNVFSQIDVDHYTNLIKNFKRVCLLGSFSKEKKIKNEEYFKFNILFIGRSEISMKKKVFFLIFGIKIFFFSIKFRLNLFKLFTYLIYDIYKSNHIFSNISAKYYVNQKFYSTSPIFNHYFKKSGGKTTSCTQKNLCALSLSCFVYTDVMFTLGKDQGKICNKLGGRINYLKPVGSLFMEGRWFRKKKDLKNVPKSDILVLGINTLYNSRHYVNDYYEKNYYKFYLNWLKKLSTDFSKKKIILKHHNDYSIDPRERNIIDKSNIKVIIKDQSINGSYAYAFNSKIILSFASTMIVEILGHGKEAYFIDPNLKGDQWFRDIKNIKKFRLGSYKSIQSIIKKKTKTYIKKDLSNYYCLNSKNTSKKIASFFKNNC